MQSDYRVNPFPNSKSWQEDGLRRLYQLDFEKGPNDSGAKSPGAGRREAIKDQLAFRDRGA